MAQLTIYLPEPVERRLRVNARRARKSLSAYVVDLIEERSDAAKDNGWPEGFWELYGSCDGGLPEIDDLPAEPVDDLL